MMRIALVSAFALFAAAASAQENDPALDEFMKGPSELDALNQGENTDFPDIEDVKARKPVSVTLRALNKITAKYQDLVVDMNATAKFGALEITPRFCDKRPPEEFPETTAFVEIIDTTAKLKSDLKDQPAALKKKKAKATQAADVSPPDAPTPEASSPLPSPHVADTPIAVAPKLPENTIFSGWMFASTPALTGVEHPVYDVWVIDCKTVDVES